MRYLGLCVLMCVCVGVSHTKEALGQVFGVELHNTLMPASGAMGGTSIARPQDFLSGINGNPATLTQFQGTQFTFSSAWAEATVNQTQTGNIPFVGPPLIEPFSAKSSAPGSAVANVGISQDLSELGMPATLGVGFITSSGLLVDYTHVPASRGASSGLFVFNVPVSLGVDLTDNWSVGASTSLGIGLYDGPFVGVSNLVMDYGMRGTLGTNYKLNKFNTVGAYYQTKQSFTFENGFVLIPGPGNPLPNTITQDVELDLPENFGLGFANTSFMDGRLLLAADLLYKVWNEAETFGTVYDNQWVVQLGSQYSINRYRLRAGYVWAENPIDQTPGTAIGGVIEPGDIRAVRFTQGLMAVTSQHRISGGVGIQDLLPGIDMDMMAGGMFRSNEQLGNFTSTSIESYWIGAGLTWRFGRGACGGTSAPNSFLSESE